MTKLSKAIEIATEQAKKASGNFKHGCVIMSGKTVISKGYNHLRNNVGTLSIHAEMEAIWRLDSDLHGSNKKAIIVRVNALGQLANSRPCTMCMCMLKENNVKTIIYSTSFGHLKMEQIL